MFILTLILTLERPGNFDFYRNTPALKISDFSQRIIIITNLMSPFAANVSSVRCATACVFTTKFYFFFFFFYTKNVYCLWTHVTRRHTRQNIIVHCSIIQLKGVINFTAEISALFVVGKHQRSKQRTFRLTVFNLIQFWAWFGSTAVSQILLLLLFRFDYVEFSPRMYIQYI